MARLDLTMPKMSMTMEEGTMVAWLKEPGDPVRQGEPVAEVATDKVDMEVESPYDGVLAEQLAQPDDVLAVGAPIGRIDSDSDDLLGGLLDGGTPEEPADEPAAAAPAATEPVPSSPPAATPAPAAASSGAPAATPRHAAGPGWPAAVPAARTRAAERGVDLGSVRGTGAWGAIRVADVEGAQAAQDLPADVQTAFDEVQAAVARLAAVVHARPAEAEPAAAAQPAAAPEPAAAPAKRTSRKPGSKRERLRQQVAKAMERSASVPQFTAWIDLDLDPIDRVRKTELGGAGWTAVLVRAQGLALAATPALLGHWAEDQAVDPDDGIGVALAIDGPDGLVAPVVRDPHERSLAEVSADIQGLVGRTRDGGLTADDLAGGTTVFSNLGGFGVRVFNALITPPHATALSAGAIERRVAANADGSFGVRLQCSVGLTVDHRVADGADAARALQELARLVADPSALV